MQRHKTGVPCGTGSLGLFQSFDPSATVGSTHHHIICGRPLHVLDDHQQSGLHTDVELLLELLTIFKLTINYKKTAFLLRLEGKDASKILSEHYLGTKIAYKHRQDLNAAHRIEAAQNKYQMIRKVLNGRGPRCNSASGRPASAPASSTPWKWWGSPLQARTKCWFLPQSMFVLYCGNWHTLRT